MRDYLVISGAVASGILLAELVGLAVVALVWKRFQRWWNG